MLMCRVVLQERNDKYKVYSLHEPSVACLAKGKEPELLLKAERTQKVQAASRNKTGNRPSQERPSNDSELPKKPVGDGINTMLTAVAYNARHWILKYKMEILLALLQIIQDIRSLFSIFTEPHDCVLLQPILGNDEKWGLYKV